MAFSLVLSSSVFNIWQNCSVFSDTVTITISTRNRRTDVTWLASHV